MNTDEMHELLHSQDMWSENDENHKILKCQQVTGGAFQSIKSQSWAANGPMQEALSISVELEFVKLT